MTQSFIAREQSSPQDDDSILLQELHPSPHSHCGLWGQQMIRTVWCEAAYPRSRVLIQTIATLLLLVCWFPGPEFNIQVNAKLKGFVFQLTPRPMWLNWISVADFQLPRYDSTSRFRESTYSCSDYRHIERQAPNLANDDSLCLLYSVPKTTNRESVPDARTRRITNIKRYVCDPLCFMITF